MIQHEPAPCLFEVRTKRRWFREIRRDCEGAPGQEGLEPGGARGEAPHVPERDLEAGKRSADAGRADAGTFVRGYQRVSSRCGDHVWDGWHPDHATDHADLRIGVNLVQKMTVRGIPLHVDDRRIVLQEGDTVCTYSRD